MLAKFQVKRAAISCILIVLLGILCSQMANADGIYTFPNNTSVISQLSFYNNTSVSKAVLPEGIAKIESLSFAYSSLTEINLPDSLTEIAEDAFEGCSLLKKVIAQEGSYAYEWGRKHGFMPRSKALLIGEKTFLRSYSVQDGEKEATYYKLEYANRNAGDVANMAGMINRICSVKDGNDYDVTRMIDIGYDEIRRAIQTTFIDSADQDVSLIFIATHGLSAGDGDLEMAFTGDVDSLDDIRSHISRDHLDFKTLAQWISDYVKGEVIIILESCGSGSAIYINDNEQNSSRKRAKKQGYDPETFTEAAISAFAAEDDGHQIQEGGTIAINSTGDFRVPRFYVLAAARHHEESWGEGESVTNPQNYFTKWMIEGIGYRGHSPADSNSDNYIGQNEIFEYVKQIGNNHPFSYNGNTYYQHVQCYPSNSDYNMFELK